MEAALEALTRTMKEEGAATRGAIADLSTRLGAVEMRLGAVETRLGAVETRLGAVEQDVRALRGEHKNNVARLKNGLNAHVAQLEHLPCDRAGDAWPVGVAQPGTMLDLAVAGNESKPGLATRSEWNHELSRAFLRTAVEGYAEDASDGEGELGAKARTMRIKVIQAMGGDVASVFPTQYQFI